MPSINERRHENKLFKVFEYTYHLSNHEYFGTYPFDESKILKETKVEDEQVHCQYNPGSLCDVLIRTIAEKRSQ